MKQNKLLHLFVHLGSVVFGGAFYIVIELIWRGYSHWTTGALGGTCFAVIGLLNEALSILASKSKRLEKGDVLL